VRFINSIFLFVALLLTGCGSLDLFGMGKQAPSVSQPVSQPASPPVSYPAPNGPVTPPPSANPAATSPDFTSYRKVAASKIMQTNPNMTFGGAMPERLLSIPVLDINLNADGSVASIDVLRTPHFAPESIGMAKEAIMRAAPFGSVAHLPRPWQFSETFLFNDNLKFQLHSLQP
jgi:hypothetical protein